MNTQVFKETSGEDNMTITIDNYAPITALILGALVSGGDAMELARRLNDQRGTNS